MSNFGGYDLGAWGAFGIDPRNPGMNYGGQPAGNMSYAPAVPTYAQSTAANPNLVVPDFSVLSDVIDNTGPVATPEAQAAAAVTQQGGGGAGGTDPKTGGDIAPEWGTFDKVQLGVKGLATLANLYLGFKQLGLAKKQFKYQKEASDININNQIKSYNTALSDRARSRAVVEGQSDAQRDAYVNKNKMSR